MPNVHSGDKEKECHHGCGYSELSLTMLAVLPGDLGEAGVGVRVGGAF